MGKFGDYDFKKIHNKYANEKWSDLPKEAQNAALVLGYSSKSWDKEIAPESVTKAWENLTVTQREAAKVMGYSATSWNADDESQTVGSSVAGTVSKSTGSTSGTLYSNTTPNKLVNKSKKSANLSKSVAFESKDGTHSQYSDSSKQIPLIERKQIFVNMSVISLSKTSDNTYHCKLTVTQMFEMTTGDRRKMSSKNFSKESFCPEWSPPPLSFSKTSDVKFSEKKLDIVNFANMLYVEMKQTVSANFVYEKNYEHYPFDCHDLAFDMSLCTNEFQIFPCFHQPSFIELKVDQFSMLQWSFYTPIAELFVKQANIFSSKEMKVVQEKWPTIRLRIKIQRIFFPLLFQTFFLFGLLTALSTFCFVIEEDFVSDRLMYVATLMLSMMLAQLANSKTLPNVGYLTTAHKYQYASFLFVLIIFSEVALFSVIDLDRTILFVCNISIWFIINVVFTWKVRSSIIPQEKIKLQQCSLGAKIDQKCSTGSRNFVFPTASFLTNDRFCEWDDKYNPKNPQSFNHEKMVFVGEEEKYRNSLGNTSDVSGIYYFIEGSSIAFMQGLVYKSNNKWRFCLRQLTTLGNHRVPPGHIFLDAETVPEVYGLYIPAVRREKKATSNIWSNCTITRVNSITLEVEFQNTKLIMKKAVK